MTDSVDVMLADTVFQLSRVLGYGDASMLVDSGVVRGRLHGFSSEGFSRVMLRNDEAYNTSHGHRDILGATVGLRLFMDSINGRFLFEYVYGESFEYHGGDGRDSICSAFPRYRDGTVGPLDYVTVMRVLALLIYDDDRSDAVTAAAALAGLVARFTGSPFPVRVAWLELVDEHPELSIIREPSREPVITAYTTGSSIHIEP